MIFGGFLAFLCLICISFYLVKGQTTDKTDCTKYYNFVYGDTKNYSNICCEAGIKCDNNGYIKSLALSGRSRESLDFTSFPTFSRLEELNISNFDFKEIPEGILNSTFLKILTLSEDNIEIVSPSIQNLSQLEELYISQNNIKEIPSELFNLKKLKKLALDKNNIEIIPPTIQNLSKYRSFIFTK